MSYSVECEATVPGDLMQVWATWSDLATAPGQVRVVKTYTAHGPISPLFRMYFARGIRKENPDTFAALALEVQRRHG